MAWLAQFTPAAALRTFEHGELRFATVAVLLAAGLAGFGFAGVWLDPYARTWSRVGRSAVLVGLVLAAVWASSSWRSGWDLSEDRRISFSRADEAALRRIHDPVSVTVHLAPEDPKRLDLEVNVLAKLRRVLPDLRVAFASQSQTGLFEGADNHYGEIWYEIAGRRALVRSTIEPVVLAEIYNLARVVPPAGSDPPYPGYPLAAKPRGAVPLFFLAWPLAVGLAFAASRRRWRSS